MWRASTFQFNILYDILYLMNQFVKKLTAKKPPNRELARMKAEARRLSDEMKAQSEKIQQLCTDIRAELPVFIQC